MRARGINYGTGFLSEAQRSRKTFARADVERDMAVIARELHCDAVRVSGGDPVRLSIAAEVAAGVGLEVWFAPFPVDLPAEEMLPFFADCARRAEAVRRGGAQVVFVAGCEISAFGNGFIPGATYGDRLEAMAGADREWWSSLGPVQERLKEFLGEAAAVGREHFGGRVTYAAGPWEFIDGGPFDLVGIDAYRAAYNTETFRGEIREHFKHGKPVAVTEYGTCAYRGAAERGGMAWQVPEGAVRDEGEQVRYFTYLLDVFEEEGVDTALWFTFAGFGKVGELDASSYGVVRMLDEPRGEAPGEAQGETRWEPKAALRAMAARYEQPEPNGV